MHVIRMPQKRVLHHSFFLNTLHAVHENAKALQVYCDGAKPAYGCTASLRCSISACCDSSHLPTQVAQRVLDHTNSVLGTLQYQHRSNLKELLSLYNIRAPHPGMSQGVAVCLICTAGGLSCALLCHAVLRYGMYQVPSWRGAGAQHERCL